MKQLSFAALVVCATALSVSGQTAGASPSSVTASSTPNAHIAIANIPAAPMPAGLFTVQGGPGGQSGTPGGGGNGGPGVGGNPGGFGGQNQGQGGRGGFGGGFGGNGGGFGGGNALMQISNDGVVYILRGSTLYKISPDMKILGQVTLPDPPATNMNGWGRAPGAGNGQGSGRNGAGGNNGANGNGGANAPVPNQNPPGDSFGGQTF